MLRHGQPGLPGLPQLLSIRLLPLRDDPAGILALPEGFSYRVVTRTGETELDGGLGKTPGDHDGTAVFQVGNRLRLIQNHELEPYDNEHGVPHVPGTVYDEGAPNAGGCTVIETDRGGRRLGEWVGISGTLTNCAGSATPWGTWLTCEETETRAGTAWSEGEHSGTYAKDHGYVFEVRTEGRQDPRPIKAFGRFAHEALAVSPDRTRVHLSEDASGPTGLFYRWTAPRGTRLGPGEGVFGTDTGAYIVNSYAFAPADLPADAVKHDGLVWFYDYRQQTIALVAYFPHQTSTDTGASPRFSDMTFDGPDNVTMTPWGTLILAEDGVGASHVLSTIPGGPTYAVARNQLNIGTIEDPEYSEFTGPTFSPDGRTLFVNIQSPGITLAITGPWSRYLSR